MNSYCDCTPGAARSVRYDIAPCLVERITLYRTIMCGVGVAGFPCKDHLREVI